MNGDKTTSPSPDDQVDELEDLIVTVRRLQRRAHKAGFPEFATMLSVAEESARQSLMDLAEQLQTSLHPMMERDNDEHRVILFPGGR